MADKSWKAFERRVARIFGGKRVPLSGSIKDGRTGKGDVETDVFSIECKMRSQGLKSIFDWYLKHEKEIGRPNGGVNEDTSKRIPFLVVKQRGTGHKARMLAVIDVHDLAALFAFGDETSAGPLDAHIIQEVSDRKWREAMVNEDLHDILRPGGPKEEDE